MRYRLAADIGGTFTDVVRLDTTTGICDAAKLPSTPGDLARGLIAGFDQLTGGDYAEVLDIVHGTTHGLNAMIERSGPRVAVITTRGFRDTYEIGRGNHPEIYNARWRKPRPLVPRTDIFEIDERIRADGSIERTVDEREIAALAAEIDGQYAAVAICLLHSVVNPLHERRVRDGLMACLGQPLSATISSDISAESREFERFGTAILNAYITPVMSAYLTELRAALDDRGFTGRLSIMNSSGGLMPVTTAIAEPVRTLMSGPVGGVIGSAAVGAALGARDLIAVDMGGTSFDVSMLRSGALDVSLETQVEGVPIMVPSVNTVSVGAGGGSIAWTQAGGMRVGPRSAGARPGPIAYGRGGGEPTVTDANVVLGRIDTKRFLAGEMELDPVGPQAAFHAYGEAHGLSGAEAAEGTLAIANHTMADAIRQITLWRGVDVAHYVLVVYGGAGPMHAALIAEDLGVSQVVIPPEPGAFSAWGMLHATFSYDAVAPVRENLATHPPDRCADVLARLEAEVAERLHNEAGVSEAPQFQRSLDLRYAGQQYAITIPLQAPFEAGRLREAFEAEYARLYGFSTASARVDILNLRVTAKVAQGQVPSLETARMPALAGGGGADRDADPDRDSRPVSQLVTTFGGSRHAGVSYDRAGLHRGSVTGPAVITEPTATIVVPPGWRAQTHSSGSLVLSRPPSGDPA